jgi:hypothetical protein
MAIFYETNNPFIDLTFDEIENIFTTISEDAENKFQEYLEELNKMLSEINPFHLISVISQYGLLEGRSIDDERICSENEIEQSHVELLQALSLKFLKISDRIKFAIDAQIQRIIDILPELNRAYLKKRMAQIKKAKTKEEKAIIFLQERVRAHTQIVRNWGYYSAVITISKDIYKNVDQIFLNLYGVSATTLIELFEYLKENYEDNINVYINKIMNVFSEEKIECAVNVYYKLFGLDLNDAQRFAEYLCAKKFSMEESKCLIYSHSQLKTVEMFYIDPASANITKQFPNSCFEKILDNLSITFGDLNELPVEYIFLANPVWRKPLIKIKEKKYFCCMPQMFSSHIFRILDALGETHNGFAEIISKHRSDFLEKEIEVLFKKAFTGSKVFCNYKWKVTKDLEYETDLIVSYDTFLIIIEAKSGKITQEALRGAPDRLKNDLNKVLIEPALQSQRLYERILKNDIPENFPFNLSNTRNILRISISLEDFATVQSNISILYETGWVDNSIMLPPTFSIADLQVVFDILPTSSFRLHYIKRRAELERHKRYFGCEIDLLGAYIESSFDFGNYEFNTEPIFFTETSKKIDDYYIMSEKGNPPKPELKITRWWNDIIIRLEERSTLGFSEVALALLNYSYDKQQEIIKLFENVKNNCFIGYATPNCQNSVITTANDEIDTSMVFLAYRGVQESERHILANNIKDQAFSVNDKIKRVVVFGFNVDYIHSYPYKFVSVYAIEEKGL